jgi:putative transposase
MYEIGMSSYGNRWNNTPMEHFFRSLNTECVPKLDYRSLTESNSSIVQYIVGYYSQTRPHQYNGGISPNVAEARYWNTSKTVVSFI